MSFRVIETGNERTNVLRCFVQQTRECVLLIFFFLLACYFLNGKKKFFIVQKQQPGQSHGQYFLCSAKFLQ